MNGGACFEAEAAIESEAVLSMAAHREEAIYILAAVRHIKLVLICFLIYYSRAHSPST